MTGSGRGRSTARLGMLTQSVGYMPLILYRRQLSSYTDTDAVRPIS